MMVVDAIARLNTQIERDQTTANALAVVMLVVAAVALKVFLYLEAQPIEGRIQMIRKTDVMSAASSGS